jgi:hypothetical protein
MLDLERPLHGRQQAVKNQYYRILLVAQQASIAQSLFCVAAKSVAI